MPAAARLSAIDTALAPELVERFRADLGRVWPAGLDCDLRFGVAVSGGPDSVALLLLAQALKPGLVEAATVDHGLRVESRAEAEDVAGICARLSIPHRILPVVLEGGNIPDRARAARYAALGGWMKERALVTLMTGHHADDQAETLLMRLNRASGTGGLAGARALGVHQNVSGLLIRPLLRWRKAELEALVQRCGITACKDPSNHDLRYDRARIRRELAQAEWLDPVAIARSAEILAQEDFALDWMVGQLWERSSEAIGKGYRWRPADEPEALHVRLVEYGICFAGGRALPRSDAAHLYRRLRRGGRANVAGVLVTVEKGVWTFEPEPPRGAR
jgi:tRNA(Ile)-lysidine synthase